MSRAVGEPDPAFGLDGVIPIDLSERDVAVDFAVGSDATIYLLVQPDRRDPFEHDPTLVLKYLATGFPDTSFAAGGVLALTQEEFATYTELTIDGADRLVVGGQVMFAAVPPEVEPDHALSLIRLSPTGVLDTTFGDAGLVRFDRQPTFGQEIGGMEIAGDGSIVVSYRDGIDLPSVYRFTRFTPAGVVDYTADVGGYVPLLLDDDRIIVERGTENEELALLAYHSDGSVDRSFGGDGSVSITVTGGGENLYDLALAPDGDVVAVGAVPPFGGGSSWPLILRLQSDGSPAPGFGPTGARTYNLPADGNYAAFTSVAVQADDRIVAGGWAAQFAFFKDFAIARTDRFGRLDPNFSDDGFHLSKFTNIGQEVIGVDMQPDGSIVGGATIRVVGPSLASDVGLLRWAAERVQRCGGKPITVRLAYGDRPGRSDDVILGTGGADIVRAKGGSDTVCGLGGGDMLNGGPGDDTLLGGRGDDTLNGGPGDDQCRGGAGADQLRRCP